MATGSTGRTLAFVGTLNRPAPYLQGARGQGLHVLAFDDARGALTPLSETSGIDNPSYLTVDAAGRFLYATSEVFGWHEGVVTAYRIDAHAGTLNYINKQPTRGSISAHASIDRSGRWLLVANYRLGPDGVRPPQAVIVYPIEADGGIGAPVCSVGHHGHGADAERQEGPHPHCALASHDNRHVVVADLGIDRLMVYAFDAASGQLVPASRPFAALPAGSGPRHLAWHPDGRSLLVITELSNTIMSFAWDPATGGLEGLHSIGTLPAAWHGDSHCSDVQIAPDGRFVYGANRGHDSIAIVGLDPTSGILGPVGHHATLGATPRQFTLDPSGRFLLIANQNADAVVVLARDAATGLLSDTGQRAEIGTPMCVKLVRY